MAANSGAPKGQTKGAQGNALGPKGNALGPKGNALGMTNVAGEPQIPPGREP